MTSNEELQQYHCLRNNERHVHCSKISVEQYQNGDNQARMSIDDHNKMTRIKELTTTITDVIRLHD